MASSLGTFQIENFPFTGHTLYANQTVSVRWYMIAPYTYSLLKLEYSTDGGSTWVYVANLNTEPYDFEWAIPAGIDSAICVIKLSDVPSLTDFEVSDPFSISSITSNSTTAVHVVSPNGGETVNSTICTIKWYTNYVQYLPA